MGVAGPLRYRGRYSFLMPYVNAAYVQLVLLVYKVTAIFNKVNVAKLRVTTAVRVSTAGWIKCLKDQDMRTYEPTFVEEKLDRKNEMKARGTLLMALPNKDQLKFHSYQDAKLLMEAIEKRFQKLISQLEIQSEVIEQEDINLKLLRSLPSEWKTNALIWRNKAKIETISLDDLYKNLKIYEPEVTGSSSTSQNLQNVAFVSSNSTNSISSTNESDNTAYGVSTAHIQEDSEQINPGDLKEMDLHWEMAMLTIRARRFIKRTDINLDINGQKIGFDRSKVECFNCHKMDTLQKNVELQRIKKIEEETSPAVEDFVNSSKMIENQENAKSISDKGYHEVPPHYTENYIPPKPDLMFIDKQVESEYVDVVSNVSSSAVKTVESKVKSVDVKNKGVYGTVETKLVRKNNFSPPIIEDWNFDESEVEFKPKVEVKTVRPSIEKIKFVKTAREKEDKYDCDKREVRPVWNNSRRVNHKNFANKMTHPHPKRRFVPQAILTKSGKLKTVGTPINIVRPVNTADSKSIVNYSRPISNALKRGYSQAIRPLNKYSAYKKTIFNKEKNLQQKEYKEKGVIDSGCYRHMTGNKCYLTDYEDFDGGFVSFGDGKGRISGKGKIKIGTLDFDDVYFWIKREFSVAKTLQQNGVAERKNRTLIDAARTMLVDSKLPTSFWTEAVNPTCYVLNRALVIKPYNKTPYELIRGRPPLIDFMKPLDAGKKATEVDASQVSENGRQDTRSEFEGLLQQERQTEHINSTNSFNTVSLPVNTAGPLFVNASSPSPINVAGTPATVEEEVDMNNVVSSYTIPDGPLTKFLKDHPKDQRHSDKEKARLVAQGHTQAEGIDYDQIFALVARIEAIRLFLAYASFKDFIVYQMDVKSDFLYGKIEEEVYVCQPHGFEDSEYPDKVYKVEKALYGLHQAPRAWYETLSTYLMDNCFHRGQIDKTLFIKRHKDDILLVEVYVDDIIFGSTRKELIQQKSDGIFISQDKYVADILKKFDFSTIKITSTPIEPNKAMVKDAEAKDVDVHLYRSMIGSLMYLTASRPDITFAVCAYVRFQVTLKTSHLYAVKRIFRYLKGQPKLGLWYPRDSPFDLEAYFDSDYAGASLDRKSTTGGCQFLGKRVAKISQSSGPTNLVADETVYMEWEDIMERATTIASSLKAEQDSGSGPRCQVTILWGATQTRFEAASKQSNDPPLLRVYTFGNGEDNIKLKEIDGTLYKTV
nr:putative ribonuclease H-like domain-containing protein [Tanacetum cinerariifolium]